MSGITTHVLDLKRGRPAEGVAVSLERRDAQGTWHRLTVTDTSDDGRATMTTDDLSLQPGTHRLVFATGEYFRADEVDTFYPQVEVTFTVGDADAHYHVPLLLSPFGYSTYRGS